MHSERVEVVEWRREEISWSQGRVHIRVRLYSLPS